MQNTIKLIALASPLVWYFVLWLSLIFQVRINLDFLSVNLWLFLLFIGTPVSLIKGLLYTAAKNYWIWFTAYMVLGVGFLGAFTL